MRALLWLTVVLATLWGGYWVVGSRAVKSGAEGWFQDQAARGLQAGHDGISVSGFPNRFDLTVTAPVLADPAAGLGWRAPFAQVFAMTWKPWHLIAALPHSQTITLPDQSIDVQSTRLMASLLLVPGTDLALDETVVEGEGLAFTSSQGWTVAAEKAVLSTRADPTRKNAHRLGASLHSLSPDPAFARQTGLPPQIDEVYLDATASLTAALDRQMAQTNPRLSALDVKAARLTWGSFKLSATGALAADSAGFAAGEITIRVEDWRKLPPVLAALGLITPDFAPTLGKGLEVLATAGADPAVLELSLVAKDGRMTLGPLPLGPAPYWN